MSFTFSIEALHSVCHSIILLTSDFFLRLFFSTFFPPSPGVISFRRAYFSLTAFLTVSLLVAIMADSDKVDGLIIG